MEVSDEPVVITPPDMSPMHQAVGRGITMFVNIEMALGFIYATIMHPAPRSLSMLTLDAVRNFSQKRDIIEAVAPYVLSDAEVKDLSGLLLNVRKLTTDRNRLAHWQTGLWHKNMPVGSVRELEEMEVRLYPALFSRDNMDFSPKHTRRVVEVEAIAERFSAAFKELVQFEIAIKRRIVPSS